MNPFKLYLKLCDAVTERTFNWLLNLFSKFEK